MIPSLKILNNKQLSMVLLGFASGLPYMLIFSTLATWLAVADIDIKTIGFFAWVTLTYSLKVLWAPLVDNFSIPFLNKYGKRKSWIISMQILIIFGLFALSITNPASDLKFFACIAFFIALCGSFNDIAVDAFRIELAEIEEQASLAAGYQLGYRAAILLASSGALIIASRTSWEFVYQAMSLIMVFGIIGSLIVKENDNPSLVKLSILNSFWMPLKDFYKRFGLYLASLLLLIISTYRLTDIITGQITNVFYIKMGFSLDEIALVVKFIALGASLAGFYLGTFFVKKFDISKALIIGAFLVMLTNLFFAYIAISEKSLISLSIIVGLDSIAAGVVGTVNITFLTSLVSKKYTAFQYALLTSIMMLMGKILSGFSGIIIDSFRSIIFKAMTLVKDIRPSIGDVINSASLMPEEISNIVISANNIVIKSHDYAWMFFYISTSFLTIPSIIFIIIYIRRNKNHSE